VGFRMQWRVGFCVGGGGYLPAKGLRVIKRKERVSYHQGPLVYVRSRSWSELAIHTDGPFVLSFHLFLDIWAA
jgi:hypothetical protein